MSNGSAGRDEYSLSHHSERAWAWKRCALLRELINIDAEKWKVSSAKLSWDEQMSI
ncbi:hypothetical protein [Herminiimonas sp. KBW02]|uniref:hypothetical protein n=1 Tax=Herminiimonas sp. KBW02 TaxID=2153363 RepID=UPI0013151A11|nr:hypothetical protein [Herminiimonas sp. KBW02]